MPLLATFPKDPADYVAARKWMSTEYPKLPKAIQAERFQPRISSQARDVQVEYGNDQQFSLRVYEPIFNESSPRTPLLPALIMVHGGGWIHGDATGDEEICQFFVSELRGVVINVDYRLAPEYPFPKPMEDVFEAVNWVSGDVPLVSKCTLRTYC